MIARLVAGQLRRPSGRLGRVFGHLLNRSNRGMNRRAVAHLDVRTGQHLLDVGFGGGVGIESMFEVASDIRVDGVDFSAEMLQQQRKRLAARIGQGRVHLALGDVADLAYADATFDRVLSVNTIYFWPDPVVGLKEIARVLAPGGRLVLGCATKQQLEKFPPAQHGFSHYDVPEIDAMLQKAGLVGTEHASANDEPFFFSIAHRAR